MNMFNEDRGEEMAEHQDFCKKDLLIDLQNQIVDPRFMDMTAQAEVLFNF